MAQYIDKAAVVAEIERLIEIANNNYAKFLGNRSAWAQQRGVCEKLLSFLNTLETKEVDLEGEVESYWKQCDLTWCRDAYTVSHIRIMLSDIAKHFYELGLAQKGE